MTPHVVFRHWSCAEAVLLSGSRKPESATVLYGQI